MKTEKLRSYTISDFVKDHQKKIEQLRQTMPASVDLTLHDCETDMAMDKLEGGYTRIVTSHVMEHIHDPKRTILRSQNCWPRAT
jgi:hypothetical protein